MGEEMTIEMIEGMIRESDPDVLPGSEEYQAALVMLSAMHRGHADRVGLAAFTGVPLARVSAFAERLEAGRVWSGDGTADVACYEEGDICFWLDVTVATGDNLRTICDDGRPAYRATSLEQRSDC